MVGESVDRDRECWIGKVLDHITILHEVLALSSWVLPKRRDVVDAVKTDKGIIEGLRDFVAVRGHVLEAAAEDAGIDPTGIIQDEESGQVAVAGKVSSIAGLEIEGVKPEHATVVPAEQEGVRKQEGRDVLSRNGTGDLSLPNDG